MPAPGERSVPNEEELRRLREYLAENRDRYDRAALRRRLVEGGHDPRDVAAAERDVYGDTQGPGGSPDWTWTWVLAMTPIIVAVNLLVVPFAVLIIAANVPESYATLALLPVLLLPIEAVVGLVIRFTVSKGVGRGILVGLGATFVVAIVGGVVLTLVSVLLAGVCILAFKG